MILGSEADGASTLEAVAEILAESSEPRETARLLSVSLKLISRDALRQLRETRELLRPGWLELEPPCERDGFDWPTWQVSRRPFDWGWDESDLPAPAPQLPGDRRRMVLDPRPPAPVVQP